MTPLVAVMLTTYNRASLAAPAIESVLAQTHPSLRLLIVDNRSTDGTAELVQSNERSAQGRVQALLQPSNRGLAASIITGLRHAADADFVAILNDDDRWLPTKLERQLELFAGDPALGLVYCDATVVDDDYDPTGQRFSDIYGQLDGDDQFDELLRGNRACASTVLLRQDVAARAASTMPEPSRGSDFYIMLVAAGYSSVASLADSLAIYRESPSGMHVKAAAETWRDTGRTLELLFARNPALVRRVGGRAAARRRVALLALDIAVRQLRAGAWGEYAWHAGAPLRQRSLRPAAWLLIHPLRVLAETVRNPADRRQRQR